MERKTHSVRFEDSLFAIVTCALALGPQAAYRGLPWRREPEGGRPSTRVHPSRGLRRQDRKKGRC